MEAVLDMPTADEIDEARAASDAGEDAVPAETPDDLDPTPDEDPSGQLKIGFKVGGKKPTSVSLRLAGGKVEVQQELEKGSLVRISYLARVTGVHFTDSDDPKTGQVVGCERKQIAKAIEPPTVTPVES
jgi:hypothetical protein